MKAKNETSLCTYLIKEQSVGELQRHPSCSMTCCLKCSCLKCSLCDCSLQCCGYTAAQQIVSKQSSLQCISNSTLSICLQKQNQRRLQNEQIAVHLHFYLMNHTKYFPLPLCFFVLSVLGEMYNFLLKGISSAKYVLKNVRTQQLMVAIDLHSIFPSYGSNYVR